MVLLSLLASTCSLLSLVSALPVASPVRRDVWDPPVTWPDASTVWVAGDTYNVTWSISNEPVNVTDSVGMVLLRHGVNADEVYTLAQGFPLNATAINVTVPADVEPDTDWIIMLMGDSGNWSPQFTIVAP
ncbi:hypothetical protein JVU11DRAFT_10742 [Chiua virens]|nr:hypothetical protein JVU11DRAFT_10742 [Chiua virens]